MNRHRLIIFKECLEVNISELIKELEQFKKAHGDLKVCVCGEEDIEVTKGFIFADDSALVCYIDIKDYEDECDW